MPGVGWGEGENDRKMNKFLLSVLSVGLSYFINIVCVNNFQNFDIDIICFCFMIVW